MEKPRRSVEENKRISIATIVILVFILIINLFLIIYLLFANSETNKKVTSVNEEIELLKLETSTLNDKKEEIDIISESVSDPSIYLSIQKDNYRATLPSIEDRIKDYDVDSKVAYLAFVVDNIDNLDNTINTLNNNSVLATFFTNDKEAADKIVSNGHLVGLYIDDETIIDNIKEEYKDIIDAYDPNLFMLSSDLKEKDIQIESFYKVVENSTSEGKKLLNQEGYTNDIVETTADRDFLIIRINTSNGVGVNSINSIISKLKDKNYVFLPLVSSSSLIEK